MNLVFQLGQDQVYLLHIESDRPLDIECHAKAESDRLYSL
jgi:hypothetical protein